MNLSLLILLPLLTAVTILFCNGLKQVRSVALAGSAAQLLLGIFLLVVYWQERNTGNLSPVLFEYSVT
ncbi:MAG: NADH-quinone oxidoreductase subunit M, partial [Bacteroidota bacterium]